MTSRKWLGCVWLAILLCVACAARKPGQPLKPGWNTFTREQDIQLGREAATRIRQQVDIVDNRELQEYISGLGRRLASQAQAGGYPYTFTFINDDSINAFALPGGPIFVHSGLLKAADNEGQAVGVLAHEVGHVALRHGTNQASKENLVQLPAALAGAVLGNESLAAQLGQLGLGLGVNSMLLKYSRDAERQSDAFGATLMAGAGYNPLEMARFFEKLEAEDGSRAPQFLSSHPDPGNRIAAVQAEIRTLPQQRYSTGTGQFDRMKQLVADLPSPKRAARKGGTAAPPPALGDEYRVLETNAYSVAYPAGWEVFGDRNSAVVTIAPREGLVGNAGGSTSIGLGTVLSYYKPEAGRLDLERSSEELIGQLTSLNRNMRVTGRRKVGINGQQALLTTLSGSSPFGGSETNLLVTVARPQGLFYMVLVGPSNYSRQLDGVFDKVLRSLRF